MELFSCAGDLSEIWLAALKEFVGVLFCKVSLFCHLLLTLLGNTGPSLSYIMISLLIIGEIALLVLESAVAMIQSYVFAVLSTLFSSEVN